MDSGRLKSGFLFFRGVFLLVVLLSQSAPVGAEIQSHLYPACRDILGKNPGSIIVMDLKSREILTVVNEDTALRRAVRPGSLFKTVTALAMLSRGDFYPEKAVVCSNRFQVPGGNLTCSVPEGHGSMDLVRALGYSCSVYFYSNIKYINKQMLMNLSRRLSVGRPLNVSGLRTSGGKLDFPSNPRRMYDFIVGDDPGILMTPCHVANLLCILATGRPLNGNGDKTLIPDSHRKIILKGMALSVEKGTCREIGGSGISACGKTGTPVSDNLPGKTHGWFMGFAPAEKPRYGVVVYLEDGRGAPYAVSMARKVFEVLFRDGKKGEK